MELITLALTALATARLTRLITTDTIFDAPRERLIVALPVRLEPLAYLMQCSWCMSVWVGAGTAIAWYAWGDTRAYLVVTAALAFSHITGWLATHEGKGGH